MSALLDEREQTHGDFARVAFVAGSIRALLHRGELSDVQAEALTMIASKLARIACGNPHEPDHWRDIAGYAELVVRDLHRREMARQADTVLNAATA